MNNDNKTYTYLIGFTCINYVPVSPSIAQRREQTCQATITIPFQIRDKSDLPKVKEIMMTDEHLNVEEIIAFSLFPG